MKTCVFMFRRQAAAVFCIEPAVFATTTIRRRLRSLMPPAAQQVWRKYQDSAFKWRYVDNFAPTLAHRLRGTAVSDECERVIETLARDGLAMTTCRDLFGSDEPLRDLQDTVARLEREQHEAIAARRREAAQGSSGHKGYMHMFVGVRDARLPRDHGFVTFAERGELRGIADRYFGMR